MVGGDYVKGVRYADDQAMTASNKIGLQKIMNETNRVVRSYKIKITSRRRK